ncbi:hypothetical protein M406DRAFT_323102 [Cryphonectria parasitica EP155]|uniref:Uncharacterized protein n=1 Tax=Cryphonectria parasitica (strain ATCC 38755 / EP155) TaxID=660469 RepID=A0A9P4XYN5_CRYP1|nr:uncharacterized protein M406DRAFT_323102 [Cryphonectria parasitica EP155]KAF3763336.1 hypothetical protein M406DRAFT_323102 [Cryphonectria parasitica EP155]
MPGIFERIQSRIELFRLERRYTRHRDRRSTFVSNAIYVDGEYIYQTPNTTGSSNNSSGSSSDFQSPTIESPPSPSAMTPSPSAAMSSKERKKMHRFSSMPGFGSSANRATATPSADWRAQRASFDGAR